MGKLSVVINTLNEEKNITRAITSVKSFADEIIVVDMKSSDNTKAIAKRLGAKVYDHEKTDYVEPARNFAISKASNEWILIIDADEEVPSSLKKKIKEIIDNMEYDFVRIPRKNILFDKWIEHSGWWPDYNIRLFRSGFVTWNELIHSVPFTTGKGIDLPDKEEYAIIHYNYQSIEQFIDRLNRYTSIQAKALKNKKYIFSWKDILIKPTNEFVSRFFAREGYRDGIHGLAISLLQTFSELILYLKVWQLNKFENKAINLYDIVQEIKNAQKEINYWSADSLVKNKGGIKNKLKRKFKII